MRRKAGIITASSYRLSITPGHVDKSVSRVRVHEIGDSRVSPKEALGTIEKAIKVSRKP